MFYISNAAFCCKSSSTRTNIENKLLGFPLRCGTSVRLIYCPAINPFGLSALMRTKLNLIRTIVGISTVLVFIGTGLLMRFHYVRVYESNHLVRMMFRSIHIYILMAGLLNIALGMYLSISNSARRRTMQLVGSICILASPLILIVAFFYEPVRESLDRPLTLLGILLVLIGTMLHLVTSLRSRSSVGDIKEGK